VKAALILAGGKATRLHGERKALLTLKKKPLLQWVIESVTPFIDEIVLSGNEDLHQFGYPVAEDQFSHLGPLAGFHAGFSIITADYTFVIGCDMPFINPEVALYLFEKAKGYSCCLPREKEFVEPLCCVYKTEDVRKCCTAVIEQGKKRIWDLIQCLPHPHYVSFEEIRTIDHNLLTFRNINTLEDLEAAEKIMEDM
jgi:molybdopterin-guanine dinucleotide biosynthesis protein A